MRRLIGFLIVLVIVLLGLLLQQITENGRLHTKYMQVQKNWNTINIALAHLQRWGAIGFYDADEVDLILEFFEYRTDIEEAGFELTGISSRGLLSLATLPNLERVRLKSENYMRTTSTHC